MTAQQIHQLTPGWDIWRDGCPGGESTTEVSRRADSFLDAYADVDPQPLVVVTHGHFSRILAARSLRLPPEDGRLFASATASVSLIEDHHGERCIGLWNADAALVAYASDRTAQPTAPTRSAGPRSRATAMTGRRKLFATWRIR